MTDARAAEVAANGAELSTSAVAFGAGFFFAFRTMLVLISARWLNAGTELGVSASFVLSGALLIAALLQSVGPSRHISLRLMHAGTFRWVMAFLAFSCLSLVWTLAASPGASALYWCALAADVAIVVVCCKGANPAAAGYSVMKGFIWSSCLLSAIAWMLPAAEDLRLGDIDYFNTNQIGNLCALSLFLCAYLANRGQGKWRLATVLLSLTLFRSLSKSTLVAFIASQLYRLLADRGISPRRKALFVVSALVVMLIFWGLIDAYIGVYTDAGNQAETLTGRTAIWAWTLDAALARPWIGNGIDAMWKVAPPFGGEFFEARHAENELLQQFFAYGAMGVVLLVGIYGSLWRRSRAIADRSERSILNALLLFAVIRGFAEAEPFDLLLPLWLITTVVLIIECAPAAGSLPSPDATALLSEAPMGLAH